LPFNPFRTAMHYCVCQDIISRHIITQYNPAFGITKCTSGPRTCKYLPISVFHCQQYETYHFKLASQITYFVHRFCNLKPHTSATRFMVMLAV
jgi:hypothetical protein